MEDWTKDIKVAEQALAEGKRVRVWVDGDMLKFVLSQENEGKTELVVLRRGCEVVVPLVEDTAFQIY